MPAVQNLRRMVACQRSDVYPIELWRQAHSAEWSLDEAGRRRVGRNSLTLNQHGSWVSRKANKLMNHQTCVHYFYYSQSTLPDLVSWSDLDINWAQGVSAFRLIPSDMPCLWPQEGTRESNRSLPVNNTTSFRASKHLTVVGSRTNITTPAWHFSG